MMKKEFVPLLNKFKHLKEGSGFEYDERTISFEEFKIMLADNEILEAFFVGKHDLLDIRSIRQFNIKDSSLSVNLSESPLKIALSL